MMTVLVRPLPFNEPESLGVIHGYFTEDDILAFREQATTFAQIVVGYSCKRRVARPNCSARRMCMTAARLVKHVPPADAPLRQWSG